MAAYNLNVTNDAVALEPSAVGAKLELSDWYHSKSKHLLWKAICRLYPKLLYNIDLDLGLSITILGITREEEMSGLLKV